MKITPKSILNVCLLLILITLINHKFTATASMSTPRPVETKDEVVLGKTYGPTLLAQVVEASTNDNEEKTTYEVKSGETFIGILNRTVGYEYNQAYELVEDIEEHFDVTKIKVGDIINIYQDNDNYRLTYDIDVDNELSININTEGYTIEVNKIEYAIEEVTKSGVITSNFYSAGQEGGLTDKAIMSLASIFAWDVDFFNSIQAGDNFTVTYENRYRDGEFVGIGDIKAARFKNQDKNHYAYLVISKEGDRNYYDQDGKSKRRALKKTPLNYTRISSGFSLNRKHPITGYVSRHRAIDFAAPTGTPVESVGNGTVIFSGWNGPHGKYVKIRHNSEFTTAYAHLSKINVKKGQKVSQGQIIGQVGSTGRSTGPHLHYEMYKNGDLVNPLTTITPAGKDISDSEKPILDAIISKYIDNL